MFRNVFDSDGREENEQCDHEKKQVLSLLINTLSGWRSGEEIACKPGNDVHSVHFSFSWVTPTLLVSWFYPTERSLRIKRSVLYEKENLDADTRDMPSRKNESLVNLRVSRLKIKDVTKNEKETFDINLHFIQNFQFLFKFNLN